MCLTNTHQVPRKMDRCKWHIQNTCAQNSKLSRKFPIKQLHQVTRVVFYGTFNMDITDLQTPWFLDLQNNITCSVSHNLTNFRNTLRKGRFSTIENIAKIQKKLFKGLEALYIEIRYTIALVRHGSAGASTHNLTQQYMTSKNWQTARFVSSWVTIMTTVKLRIYNGLQTKAYVSQILAT